MKYVKGSALVCGDCHDSHGSSNRFMLHESVKALAGGESADSLLVVPLSGGGADLRLFCDSCHEVTSETHPAADLSQWPVDCTACHNHVGGGL
jgi:predicted CXXCH cytochrome family protein